MNKGTFLNELFNNIKDKIEFDSDIMAIYRILIGLLRIDMDTSIQNWQYIFNNYDIQNLKKDIDFTPLLNTFPTNLFETMPLEKFYQILENMPYNNLIYDSIFNVFDNTSAVYTQLNKLITNNEVVKEKETIKIILEHTEVYPKKSFDVSTFLRNVILMHLNQKRKNIPLLLEYTDIPEDIKDKSVLKTLLIDYL